MIEFGDQIDFHSKVKPGVVFRLRRINLFERIRRDEKISAQLNEHDDAADEINALRKEPSTAAGRAEARKLERKRGALFNEQIVPHRIRDGFISVSGMADKHGEPITTVDDFLKVAGTQLIGELYSACVEASDLSIEAQGNSSPLGTSSDPGTPSGQNTNADTASGPSSTSNETALGISRTTSIAA